MWDLAFAKGYILGHRELEPKQNFNLTEVKSQRSELGVTEALGKC
jgi:hypothetical protein